MQLFAMKITLVEKNITKKVKKSTKYGKKTIQFTCRRSFVHHCCPCSPHACHTCKYPNQIITTCLSHLQISKPNNYHVLVTPANIQTKSFPRACHTSKYPNQISSTCLSHLQISKPNNFHVISHQKITEINNF